MQGITDAFLPTAPEIVNQTMTQTYGTFASQPTTKVNTETTKPTTSISVEVTTSSIPKSQPTVTTNYNTSTVLVIFQPSQNAILTRAKLEAHNKLKQE